EVRDVGVPARLILVRAPRVGALFARARRVFPLGFARQPIGLAGFAREPRHVSARIGPAHANDRVVFGDQEIGPGPVDGGVGAVDAGRGIERGAGRVLLVPALLDEDAVLPHGDLVAAHQERARDLDAVLRPLLGVAADLALGRAHRERAGGDLDQFRA